MKENNFSNKVIIATKWSTITEVMAKLVSPVTNMILARIISPEAFGVVATVTMIVSFADMFTDSGFQKYLVQHEFENKEEIYINANVAFWTNFCISILLWMTIILFRDYIAILVGNPSLGRVIAIACLQLPLTSFSSIQMALYRRDFDFKTLFIVRMISVCIPFLITIPLALLGLKYWALIIGSISIQLLNAIILTLKSKWKPKFNYDLNVLKEMLSFSIWSLIEAISIWLSTWADAFIIGNALSQYYLGIYMTSITMVNALMLVITGSITPVLFSTLSRLQNDKEKFYKVFLKFQKSVSIIVFPLGAGVYLYSDLATKIMLGSQWSEASNVIGVWALTSSIHIVLSHFCSELYRAKGNPKLSFIAQILHLIILIPACIISSNYGFWPLVYVRSWIRLEMLFVHFIIMKYVVKFSFMKMVKNVSLTAIASLFMFLFGTILQQVSSGIVWSVFSILLCSIFYFGILMLNQDVKHEILGILRGIIPKNMFRKV